MIYLLMLSLQIFALEKSQVLDVRGALNLVDGPSGRNSTSMSYPAYEEIEAKLANLARKHAAQARHEVYGQTVDGRNLNMLRIARQDVNANTRLAVEISGVIHGNEYLGIEDRLAEHFLNNQDEMPGLKSFLEAGGIVYMIPIINPDGFSDRRRLNRNGSDLNRDFDLLPRNDKRFSQPETRALAAYLDNDLKNSSASLKLSMDYHCCVPALITPWTYIDAQPEPKDHEAFRFLTGLQSSLLGYEFGNAMDTVGYLAPGSSIDYFYAKYGTLALTIEGNWWGEVEQLPKHIRFWDQVFAELARTAKRRR